MRPHQKQRHNNTAACTKYLLHQRMDGWSHLMQGHETAGTAGHEISDSLVPGTAVLNRPLQHLHTAVARGQRGGKSRSSIRYDTRCTHKRKSSTQVSCNFDVRYSRYQTFSFSVISACFPLPTSPPVYSSEAEAEITEFDTMHQVHTYDLEKIEKTNRYD